MSIPDSDSDDELLNFVAFSPKIKKARMEKSSYAECTTTSTIANASTSRRPGKGRADQNQIEQSAKRLAQVASITVFLKCPSTLYWCRERRRKGYKRKLVYDYYPCRECHPDEATGLSLPQKWDNEGKALIQHIEKRMFTDREIVPRSKLIPYYGGNPGDKCIEGKRQWCANLVEMLLSRLKAKASSQIKKKRKPAESESVDICVQSEIIFMKRVLECAFERQEESALAELRHHQDETEPFKAQSALVSQDVNDTDDMTTNASDGSSDCDRDSLSDKKHKRRERIRPKDIIAYFRPPFAMGDQRGYSTAKIISVDPKGQPVLQLDPPDFLPRDHLIKRIEIVYRGKMVDYTKKGTFRQIDEYALTKAVMEENTFEHSVGLIEQSNHLKRAIDESRQILQKKVKEARMGDCSDLLQLKKEDELSQFMRKDRR